MFFKKNDPHEQARRDRYYKHECESSRRAADDIRVILRKFKVERFGEPDPEAEAEFFKLREQYPVRYALAWERLTSPYPPNLEWSLQSAGLMPTWDAE